MFYLSELDEPLGRPAVVHVVRDPRACVASLRLRWPQFGIAYGARLWADAVRAGRKWSLGKESRRYVELSYRNLVTLPNEELRALCREEMNMMGFAPRTQPAASARFTTHAACQVALGRIVQARVWARRLRRVLLWRMGLPEIEIRRLCRDQGDARKP